MEQSEKLTVMMLIHVGLLDAHFSAFESYDHSGNYGSCQMLCEWKPEKAARQGLQR